MLCKPLHSPILILNGEENVRVDAPHNTENVSHQYNLVEMKTRFTNAKVVTNSVVDTVEAMDLLKFQDLGSRYFCGEGVPEAR